MHVILCNQRIEFTLLPHTKNPRTQCRIIILVCISCLKELYPQYKSRLGCTISQINSILLRESERDNFPSLFSVPSYPTKSPICYKHPCHPKVPSRWVGECLALWGRSTQEEKQNILCAYPWCFLSIKIFSFSKRNAFANTWVSSSSLF